MARSPVALRAVAALDIDVAVDHYLNEAGWSVALKFIDAVRHAVERMSKNPLVGSLRFAYELGIPDIRVMPLDGLPHPIFYVATVDFIDVWRVLHSRGDIPAEIGEAIDEP